MATEKRRRQYGTGSVHQRASDGRWIATVEAGWTARGTRRRVSVSATTEAACRVKLKEKQRQIARDGSPTQGVSARATVKAWAQTWFEQREAHARPKYLATDRSSVRQWITPTIGHRPLAALTPADVRAVTSAVRKAGRSSTTAAYAQGVLERMLRAAMVEGHDVPPRVLLVPPPGKAVSDRTAIPLDDVLNLLAAAAELPHGSRWAAAFLQGLRQGEALGLTWGEVDLAATVLTPAGGLVPAPAIDISWQLQALPYLDRAADTFRVPDGFEATRLAGAWHLTRPKSASGVRTQPLVPWMTGALDAWRALAPASPYGLVWPREDGRPRTPPDDRAEWHELQARAGVAHPSGRPWHVHEIRHTTATLLLELSIDQATVIAIMGHSKIATTRAYQHVSAPLTRAALEQVAGRLGLTAG